MSVQQAKITSQLNDTVADNVRLEAKLNQTNSQLEQIRTSQINCCAKQDLVIASLGTFATKSELDEVENNFLNTSRQSECSNNNITALLDQYSTKAELSKVNKTLTNCCANTLAEIYAVQERISDSQDAIIDFECQGQGNSSYLVSKKSEFTSYLEPERECRLYGGYMVELDTKSEYDRVVNCLKSHHVTDYVILGAKEDPSHTGRWKYIHSQKNVTFYNWARGEPGSPADEPCLYMDPHRQWMMYDQKCLREFSGRFICELDCWMG